MSSIAFTGPVKDVVAARAFAGEVNGARRVDFVESRKRLAITKERIFLVEGTPMGAAVMVYSEGSRVGATLERAFYLHDAKMAVVYLEGDDPMAAMEKSMHSDAGYDRWFTEQISAVHGIDFRSQKPPRPELLISYDA